MNPRTRAVPTYGRADPPDASSESGRRRRLRHEISGLGYFLLGLIIFTGAAAHGAMVPPAIQSALRFLVGSVGAMIVAVSLMLWGAALIIRRHHVRPATVGLGLAMLFVVFLSLSQLPAPRDGFIGRSITAEPGGLIGLAVAELVKPLLGRILGGVFLVLVALAAVAIMSETPLASLGHRAGRTSYAAVALLVRRAAGLRRLPAKAALARVPASAKERRSRLEAVLTKRAGAKAAQPAPQLAPIAEVKPPPVPAPPAKKAEKAGAPGKQLTLGKGMEPKGGGYSLPPISLLTEAESPPPRAEDTVDKMEVLENTLRSFGIDAKVVEIERGPRVTRYEVQPPPGVRVSRITNLADDLALSLAALDVRVEAPVPGKGVIGIEVPNTEIVFVNVKEILVSDAMKKANSKLAFALGKDISGHAMVADLAKMPHLLIAGATNSGKSVCLNALIASVLFRATPDEVKFLMVDPKRVELSLFEGIPHLVAPVAHDAKDAAGLLRWALREMEHRYRLFADLGVRNIVGYNEQAAIDVDLQPMYYLVIVIDELADLMMQAATEFEASICRLAQLARATGIHLVVATQRPSVNVITGTIKANISSRIAFAVASQVDSRTILDINGAERLVGSGDMLFLPFDASKPTRIQGAYVTETDVGRLAEFLKRQGKPEYLAEALPAESKFGAKGDNDELDDEMFEKALDFVTSTGHASASMLQRRLRLGYTRAARLIDMMEERGYVGPADGSRPREVYATPLTRSQEKAATREADEEEKTEAADDDEDGIEIADDAPITRSPDADEDE